MGGGGRGRDTQSTSSSSGEEDGDAEWKAAINSITTDFNASTHSSTKSTRESNRTTDEHQDNKHIKLYQIKAQKLLEDLLDKTLMVVSNPSPTLDDNTTKEENGIRLFKNAPMGTTFDPIDEFQQPRKRPRILPGEDIEEKSKKFRRRIQAVVVDGSDIMTKAREAYQKSIARLEAKNAAAKAAAKREEERVAELKKLRGEKWLPSIAKEMQVGRK